MSEWVLVRVYRRRSQEDYRYRLCVDCRVMLVTILEEGAEQITAQPGFQFAG